MRILLDSHVFVWFAIDHVRLSETARAEIEGRDAIVHLSAAALCEVATKHRLGKWSETGPLLDNWQATMLHYDFRQLPITLDMACSREHCRAAIRIRLTGCWRRRLS